MPSPGRDRRRRLIGRLLRVLVLLGATVAVLRITGCMESLFYYPSPGPTPPPPEHPGAEAVSFESADGTRLSGWFIPAHSSGRPDGRPDGGVPTVLHVHGNAGNIESHVYFTEYLPAAGFNLLVFDYRGYGESAGSARRRDDLIADTEAALDALLARPDVDPGRIGMYAQSLGGAVGLNAMANRTEIRSAVVVSAFTKLREMAASAVGGGRPGPVARVLAAVLIKDHARPIDAMARIDRPILLLHGDADRTIPVEHGRRLASVPAGKIEFVELAGGDHNDLRATHPETDRMTIDFFRRTLAGEPID